jgi:hypothetical protein
MMPANTDVPTFSTSGFRSGGYVASRNPRDTANPYSYTVDTIGGGRIRVSTDPCISFQEEYHQEFQDTRISATATVSSADMQMHDEIKQRLTQDIRDKLYADMYGLDALKTIKSLEAKVHILEMEMYKLKQKDSK